MLNRQIVTQCHATAYFKCVQNAAWFDGAHALYTESALGKDLFYSGNIIVALLLLLLLLLSSNFSLLSFGWEIFAYPGM